MSSTLGQLFRITTWGESHGAAVGVVIDGCPPDLALSTEDVQRELDRRRPGQSHLTTQRQESDRVEILSGVFEARTLGTPIAMLVRNEDARGKDYTHMRELYRPSHADFTYDQKFGRRDWRGGGRASARETVGRVAGGAIAKLLLAKLFNVDIIGYVKQVGTLIAQPDLEALTLAQVEATPVRCPEPTVASRMADEIDAARKAGDSLGGIVECIARGVPAGWGDPVFDKLEADLAKAMLSIPACKAFEVGSGLAGITMRGSTHNDPFYFDGQRIRTRTNYSGGIQGGISNGEMIIIRAAFKPTATIMQDQDTVDTHGNAATLAGRGRHDPCVLPRAVPIVEAMMALVLADHALRQRGQVGGG